MRWLKHLRKDHLGGALMIFVGLGAVYFGMPLEIGTLFQMGPGYFPVALGVILTLLGVVIALNAKRPAEAALVPDFPGEPSEALRVSHAVAAQKSSYKPDWRGWGCILGSFVAFIFLFRYAGAVPATTAVVMISALGERKNSLLASVVLALAANVVLVVVFQWALKMPLHLFWWD